MQNHYLDFEFHCLQKHWLIQAEEVQEIKGAYILLYLSLRKIVILY